MRTRFVFYEKLLQLNRQANFVQSVFVKVKLLNRIKNLELPNYHKR